MIPETHRVPLDTTVRVERQRLQDGTVGPTKTPKSTRTVPLGQVVIDQLAAPLAAYPSDEALFTTEAGQPLTFRQWNPVWKATLSATALTAEELARMTPAEVAAAKKEGRCAPLNFDTHALRHFTASALISGGASVKQVQTVLGHSSAAITLRVYSHLWPGDEDRTRKVMDAALGPLADSVRTERASEG
ncbi:MAG: phage integrase family protein [Frankiales bacterium]|nr:phage integrase family protein [Frankiales bacterium]